MTRPVKGNPEKLYGSAHGISVCKPAESLGNLRKRIDHRGRVHGKLYSEREKDVQVTVFGRERADYEPKASAEKPYPKDNKRKRKGKKRNMDGAFLDKDRVQEYGRKQHELDRKGYDMKAAARYGRREPWEINLAENILVRGECSRAAVQAVRKICPEHGSRKIEKYVGNAVSAEVRHLSEDKHVHD